MIVTALHCKPSPIKSFIIYIFTIYIDIIIYNRVNEDKPIPYREYTGFQRFGSVITLEMVKSLKRRGLTGDGRH